MPISKMESEINQTPEVIKRLIENQQQFDSVVTKIKSSSIKSVMIAARGTSDNAAHFLKQLIEVELGIPVGLASPSVVSVYGAKLKYRDTLVIALSQSGQSPDLVAYVMAAKEGGGLTLGITNDTNSPLAKVVELHLDLLAERELAVAATKSYTAQLFASPLLVNYWKGVTPGIEGVEKEATRVLGATDGLENVLNSLSAKHSIVALRRLCVLFVLVIGHCWTSSFLERAKMAAVASHRVLAVGGCYLDSFDLCHRVRLEFI